MIELELPWPPSVNHYKTTGCIVTTRTGKLYQRKINSHETNQFYISVWAEVKSRCLKSFAGATISLEVHAYPPDKRKRDLSNILKVLEDSLQRAGLFDDDYQIARLLVERKAIIRDGKVIVRIAEFVP